MTEAPPALSRINNFDALRLTGALLVLVGHGLVLHGRADAVPVVLGIGLHPLGLAIFFAISGYLIMGSWLSRPRLSHYLTNRAARILPALVVVTVLAAMLAGPLLSTFPAADYFADPRTWAYLSNAVPVFPQYELPGVFADLPYPGAVNGSLWTLRVEFACYLGVLLIGSLPRLPRLTLLAVAGIVFAVVSQLGITIAGSNLSASAGVATYFVVGAMLRHVPARWLDIRAGLITLVPWGLLTWAFPAIAERLSFVVLPYVVISIGLAAIPGVRSAGRFGDLSYGIYLWAFPAQQTLLFIAPQLPMGVSIATAAVVSACLALLSWHLVEGPVLRNKGRLPWMRRRQLGTVQV
jgi:peptidoglycan/LPS O-acetylase OafA/YrhL